MGKFLKKSALILGGLLLVIVVVGQLFPQEKSTMATKVVSEKVLVPGGQSIGVKMDVKGVLVVGLEEIETEDGKMINPGILSGLQIGDRIMEVNGTKVYRADEVQSIVNNSEGVVKLKIKRNDKDMDITVNPVLSKDDGLYKLGLWIKDKTAGIGTLTYYDPMNSTFGALGHGIADPETGTILAVDTGTLFEAQVQEIESGKSGAPGEIKGVFYHSNEPLGCLKRNNDFGIFGVSYEAMTNSIYSTPLAIGTRDQVKLGKAYILSTLSNNEIRKFEVEIKKIEKQRKPSDKGMIIEVTDKTLLEESGGIVQGMSGSPIIQNDRIIGAVTHVFINDPKQGYGIFIEWMLAESNLVE
ncbi:MAG: SpoIVB peptidase [Clostridiales bacterium]|nr:SpoIVB peptidase [Clostridiales bacterium]